MHDQKRPCIPRDTIETLLVETVKNQNAVLCNMYKVNETTAEARSIFRIYSAVVVIFLAVIIDILV